MGSIHTQMLQKALAAGALPQTPQKRGRALSVLASLYAELKNGVNAILKWVPFTPKCSQKRWRLGLPQTPNKRGRAPSTLASLTRRREGAPFPTSLRAPWTLGTQWRRILMLLFSQRLWTKMIEVMVGVMVLRQSQRSTVAVGCCQLSCTRRLQFTPKCTKIVGAGAPPQTPLVELRALPQTP